jgi:CRP-like cAMP-binding protein
VRPFLSDPAVVDALSRSFLHGLDDRIVNSLLSSSRLDTLEPGQIVYEGRPDHQAVLLVVDGVLRVYGASPQTRQVTIRYALRGEVVGLPGLLAGGGAVIVESLGQGRARVLRFVPERFVAIAEREAELAFRLARYIARQAFVSADTLTSNIFLPVRARVARHLLDLAVSGPEGLVVTASYQDIADAVGSVREVASREIARFKEAGLVGRVPAGLLIKDPAGLHALAEGAHC